MSEKDNIIKTTTNLKRKEKNNSLAIKKDIIQII